MGGYRVKADLGEICSVGNCLVKSYKLLRHLDFFIYWDYDFTPVTLIGKLQSPGLSENQFFQIVKVIQGWIPPKYQVFVFVGNEFKKKIK